jgi:Zn-dependent M16 (insulinase) family peptidase
VAERLEKETQERVAANRERFGEEGLKRLQQALDEAQKKNDVDIPPGFINLFKVPAVESIRWIDVQTARAKSRVATSLPAPPTKELQDHIDRDGAELPYFLQFDRESVPPPAFRRC